MAMSHSLGERLWRLRKLHQQAEAELRDENGQIELRLTYNGRLVSARRWPTRDLALAEAAEKRTELEREGWMLHW
jgi:hypothetical protein